MDTQVHNTWPLTCAQHKNFINMSEIKQNQVTIYRNLSENSTKVRENVCNKAKKWKKITFLKKKKKRESNDM